jgi:GrpB-like predicted nucleotidyltransferase (UPF0157 family)
VLLDTIIESTVPNGGNGEGAIKEMLTPEQEKWINQLSDQELVVISPYDPSAPQKFEAVKRKIQAALGPDSKVVHRGATSLEISGQNEIDVYVPVPAEQMEVLIPVLTAAIGNPRKVYPNERARFVVVEEGKRVDIFLINESCQGWINGLKFEHYLRTHPDVLEQYCLHKEAGHGLTMREYYRRKTAFFNAVVLLADQEVER